MVFLITKPYKNGHLYCAKFERESKEEAIAILARYSPNSDVFQSNKYWIEDEDGKVLLTPRQTKKEAAEKWHEKDRQRFAQFLNAQ